MNLLYVIHSYTHSCHTFSYSLMSYHGRSGQTYPFHSIHTHLIVFKDRCEFIKALDFSNKKLKYFSNVSFEFAV